MTSLGYVFYSTHTGEIVSDELKATVLFQGFQKKTQKTPLKEIRLAEKLKKEYFKNKEDK